jgi:hypothetical protein
MKELLKIRDLLNNYFSDGRFKIPCVINPNNNQYTQRSIFLFERQNIINNIPFALGKTKTLGLYRKFIQVAIAHPEYDKSYELAYKVLEYINTCMIQGMVIVPEGIPLYAGIDKQKAQHIHVIDYTIKGAK